MKPIILKADQDGKILINAEDIEKMVSDAYNEGYSDGKRETPITINNPRVDYPGVGNPWLPTWYTTVTCDSVTVKGGDSPSISSNGATGSDQSL